MAYEKLKKELNEFYFNALPIHAEELRRSVFSKMDEYDRANPDLSAYQLKAKLWAVENTTGNVCISLILGIWWIPCSLSIRCALIGRYAHLSGFFKNAVIPGKTKLCAKWRSIPARTETGKSNHLGLQASCWTICMLLLEDCPPCTAGNSVSALINIRKLFLRAS